VAPKFRNEENNVVYQSFRGSVSLVRSLIDVVQRDRADGGLPCNNGSRVSYSIPFKSVTLLAVESGGSKKALIMRGFGQSAWLHEKDVPESLWRRVRATKVLLSHLKEACTELLRFISYWGSTLATIRHKIPNSRASD
jgi:hypothetical protein